MFAIQPCGLDGAEEELGAVGVWSGVGHGEHARTSVCELEVLVGELFTVDGLSAGTIVSSNGWQAKSARGIMGRSA
jgi:hypothetical protein